MPRSLPNVQIALDPLKTLRIIIQIVTILIILIVIAACISVGILVGTHEIGPFRQTSTILIVRSNMQIVLNRSRTSYEIFYGYLDLSNSSNTQKTVTDTLNQTLCEAFADSYLTVAISPLSLISWSTYYSPVLQFTFIGEAFFYRNHTGNEIKDALELFEPTITLTNDTIGDTSSGPATFNRLLSNVTDTEPTNLTLADLPYIVVMNGSR